MPVSPKMFSLDGKVALVTGSGRGMGAGIAEALAAQGATVIVNDLFEERASAVAGRLRAQGLSAQAFAADVTDGASMHVMIRRIAADFGPVDILVNNAGIPVDGPNPPRRDLHDYTPFLELKPADWESLVRLNLYAVMHGCQAVLPAMMERRWGRIVTISSEAWRIGYDMGLTAYAAAKAGAVGFMRQLSSEIRGQGVTFNCISLGAMNNFEGSEESARVQTSVGRAGRPEDVGAAVVYLASKEASWINGQVIPLNGGACTA